MSDLLSKILIFFRYLYLKANAYIPHPNFRIILTILSISFIFLITWVKYLDGYLNGIELKLYDQRIPFRVESLTANSHNNGFINILDHFKSIFFQETNKADKNIILLNIDDYSVLELAKYKGLGTGRWPWARSAYSNIAEFVKAGNPKIIVYDLTFEGAEGEYPESIKSDMTLAKTLKETQNSVIGLILLHNARAGLTENLIKVMDIDLNSNNYQLDQLVKKKIKRKYSTYPLRDNLTLKITDELSPLPLTNQRAMSIMNGITFFTFSPLYSPFMDAAHHIGIVNLNDSMDGITRYHTPLYKLSRDDGPVYLPSLSLATVLAILPEDEKKPFILKKDKIILGKREIPLDKKGRFLINWHGSGGPKSDTYLDISMSKVILTDAYLKGKIKSIDKKDFISPEIFKDKIVVIGLTKSGSDIHPTPMGMSYPGAEIQATCIDNILNDTYKTNGFIRKIVIKVPVIIDITVTLLLCSLLSITYKKYFSKKSHKRYKIKSKLLVNLDFLRSIWLLTVILGSFIVISLLALIYGYWINITYPIIFATITAIVMYLYKNYTIDREKDEVEDLFGKFVSPQVLNKLLEDPRNISREGQRKRMTVLFSDIRGFTALAETIPATELVSQLREYFTEMFEIVLKYNGTMDKFIGDAVMAFYGDPLPMKDHSLRAVLTALDMIDKLENLNKKWQQENKHVLNIGIGINTGEMIVGHMGARRMVNYTVFGDSVNLASRLEGLTKEYNTRIIISESTFNEIKDFIDADFLGQVKIRGRSEEVKVYAVKGVKPGVNINTALNL